MKLAIFFPGIGYTLDKPLMYYGQKLMKSMGYEVMGIPFGGFPEKVKGDKDKMTESYEIAMTQARDFLANVSLPNYSEVVFVGKSIGTIVAASMVGELLAKQKEESSENGDVTMPKIRLVLYTPLEATFMALEKSRTQLVRKESNESKERCITSNDIIFFTGSADPWVNPEKVKELLEESGSEFYIIKDGNHSLESGDVEVDVETIKYVMEKTREFILRE